MDKVPKDDSKLYELEGTKLTLKQWSEKTGVDFEVLFHRVKNLGWNFGNAISNNKKDKYYTYEGITLELHQWAEKLDVPYETLLSRVKNKWNFEEIVWGGYQKRYEYNGEILSVKQISEKTGICYQTLKTRLQKPTWSPEEAFSTPIIKPKYRRNFKTL